jgi:maltodextrin utilization protein YvdJ
MKKIILFLLVLNLGLLSYIQLSQSQQAQAAYPLPEIQPEKIEILNQQVFDEVYQNQAPNEDASSPHVDVENAVN